MKKLNYAALIVFCLFALAQAAQDTFKQSPYTGKPDNIGQFDKYSSNLNDVGRKFKNYTGLATYSSNGRMSKEDKRKLDKLNGTHITSDNNAPLPDYDNIQTIGSGLVLREMVDDNAWQLQSSDNHTISGGIYPQKSSKLGIHLQAGRGMVVTIADYNPSRPYIGNPAYTDWTRSHARVDRSHYLAHQLGARFLHLMAEPIGYWDIALNDVTITQELLGAMDWSNVDRDLENARRYGMIVDLMIASPSAFAGSPQMATYAKYKAFCTELAKFTAHRYKSYSDILSIDPSPELGYKIGALGDFSVGTKFSRMSDMQKTLYDTIKAEAPKMQVHLASVFPGEFEDFLAQLSTDSNLDTFEGEVSFHLYPNYPTMSAPDWYAGVPLYFDGTADIENAIYILDSYGLTDINVAIDEFGIFWNTRSLFDFTNGSSTVVASDTNFRTSTVQSPALSNGDVIQIVPNMDNLDLVPPTTEFTVSGISDSGFTITPAYSGPNLTDYKVINLTWRANSAASMTQLVDWAKAQPRVNRVQRWAMWDTGFGSGESTHPPNWAPHLSYLGHGLIDQRSEEFNEVALAYQSLAQSDYTGKSNRIVIANGAALDIPTRIQTAEMAYETDGNNRVFIGRGENTDRLEIPTGISKKTTALGAVGYGIGTNDPQYPLHVKFNGASLTSIFERSSNSTTSTTPAFGLYNSDKTDNNYIGLNFYSLDTADVIFAGAQIATRFEVHDAATTQGSLSIRTAYNDILTERLGINNTGIKVTGTTETGALKFPDASTQSKAAQFASGSTANLIQLSVGGTSGAFTHNPGFYYQANKLTAEDLELTAADPTFITDDYTTTGTKTAPSSTIFKGLSDRVPVLTSGDVVFSDGTKYTGDPAFQWDNTNKRLGIGTATPAVALHAASVNAAAARLVRSGTATNSFAPALGLYHTTSDDMVDGFGAGINFTVNDSGASDQLLGQIGAVRDGADNSGAVVIRPSATGTATEKLRIASSGLVTYSNGGGPPFGHQYSNTSTTVSVASANTWYEMTTNMTAGQLKNVTHGGSHYLVATTAGYYKIDTCAAVGTSAAGDEVALSVLVNGTSSATSHGHATVITATTTSSICSTTILSLAANDQISIGVENHSAGRDITISHAQQSMVYIGSP